MFLKRSAVHCAVLSGVVLGSACMSFAQSGAPVQEQPRDVGPRTLDGDRTIQEQERVERDRALAERDRGLARDRAGDRTVVQDRVVERRREGEVYVSGFGGFTWGHNLSDVEGRGTLGGQQFGGLDLKNSGVYGAKIGYFHPGRLNWLGLEVEGFNSTPHIEQGAGLPGTHLRVTTLAFNAIARTKVGCRNRDDVRRRDDGRVAADGTVRGYDDRTDWSPLDENARCPLQLYAGVGPGIFFAETSNQFGRSTDNGRVGLNALAGAKYFLTRNLAVYAEYKFNYAQFDFSQAQGTSAGFTGDYKASHVVGGLAMHF
jgi:opacity protein-like surface antigen